MRKAFQALVMAAAMLVSGCSTGTKQEIPPKPQRARITSKAELTKLVEQYEIRKTAQSSDGTWYQIYTTKKGQDIEIKASYDRSGDEHLYLEADNRDRYMRDEDGDHIIDAFSMGDVSFYWDKDDGWRLYKGEYGGDPDVKAVEIQRLFDIYRRLLGVDALRPFQDDYSNNMF